MKITKIIKKEVEEIKDIICNKCGRSLRKSNTDYEGPCSHGLQEVTASFGYGSDFDGSRLTFSVCEKCTFEFITSFKIEPDYLGIGGSVGETKDSLYQSIKSVYGFERTNENLKINSMRNSDDFLNQEELEKYKKEIKEELEFIEKNGIDAYLTK